MPSVNSYPIHNFQNSLLSTSTAHPHLWIAVLCNCCAVFVRLWLPILSPASERTSGSDVFVLLNLLLFFRFCIFSAVCCYWRSFNSIFGGVLGEAGTSEIWIHIQNLQNTRSLSYLCTLIALKKIYFYFFGRQMHLMPQPWKGSRDASVFVYVMVNRPWDGNTANILPPQ